MLFALAAPTLAQAPKITAVWPPVVQRGQASTVTLAGEQLRAGSRVLVSGEGVTASTAAEGGDKSLGVRLEVEADAATGVRELRLLGPNGASNAARVAIGLLPALGETEPNGKLGEAQALAGLPVTVYGRIAELGDEDSFRFQAGAGETWVFELGSVSHGSGLDGTMRLRDERGQELASVMESLDQDPRLVYTFEAAGQYTVTVRDVTYKGSEGSTYRLSVGQLPRVTRVLPLAVPRGRTTTVQLAGVNLGGVASMDVSVPADYRGDTMAVVPKTPSGDAPPVSLAVSSMPEAVEAEPNDERGRATRLEALPAAVSGVIEKDGDVDLYAFRATAGQKLTFDLCARRLGTRLDSLVRVLDASGKEVAVNDDAVGKDSRLAWSPSAAGEYFVQVTDLAGQGGDAFGYRLVVTTAAAPDFKLTVMPDVVNIPKGSAEVLTIRADRLNEFDGDIAVRVEGLPAGVTASPGRIAKGQGQDQITLTAASDVSLEGFSLRVVGAAAVGGETVERVAGPAEPGSDGQVGRSTVFQVAGVREAVPYGVTVEPQAVTLAPGAKVKLTVKLTRPKEGEAATSPIGLFVVNLPEGVNQDIPDIPADKSEGTIELKAPEKLDARETHLIVRTRIKESFRYAPAIPLKLEATAPGPAKAEEPTKEGN
jgi:hypothetical protein